MRSLISSELGFVSGGTQNPPITPLQLSHMAYERRPSWQVIGEDLLISTSEMIWADDQAMTARDREIALSEEFGLDEITRYGQDSWYADDGQTTLFDEDDDGAPDTAIRTVNGATYVFGAQGWQAR